MSVNSARPLYPPVATRLDAIDPEEFGIPHALRNQPGGGVAGLHPAWAQAFQSWYQVLAARGLPCEIELVNGVIGIKDGTAMLIASAPLAMTIGAPVAGPLSSTPAQINGDDMKTLLIFSNSAAAHTVTGPASVFNGSLHIATWGAQIGNYIRLLAFNGFWYAVDSRGVTLT